MNRRNSIVVLAVILFVLPFAAAEAQFMTEQQFQESETIDSSSGSYSLGMYLDNPCTSVDDLTFVDYDVYLYEEYRLATSRFFFDESTAMSSDTYGASGSTHSDVTYETPFTVRKYHKVNTSDNFHVVTVIDFDPATKTSTVSVETACGNGMPDSNE